MISAQIKALKGLAGKKVEAGWFESNKYAPRGADGTEEFVARIARIQEYGAVFSRPSPKGPIRIIIPSRPFMRGAYKNFLEKRRSIEHSIAKKLFDGSINADQAVGQIAMALEGLIVDSIRNGDWEPNAPSTISKKGFDKPLIDSAIMWQSVNSKVTG